jgi:chromate reductase, NAD(P)H dehydrogenase (quinone)
LPTVAVLPEGAALPSLGRKLQSGVNVAKLKILTICGSLRSGSTNAKLVAEARRVFGAATFVKADLRLSLYDGDLETAKGIPAKVQKLADQIRAADGVIVCTPEYNKALSGVLKNALDWVSRTKGVPWRDKPVAILSAAAGRGGGDRAQFSLRLCLTPFRPRLISGPEVMVADSGHAFDEAGQLIDAKTVEVLTELMGELRAEIARN